MNGKQDHHWTNWSTSSHIIANAGSSTPQKARYSQISFEKKPLGKKVSSSSSLKRQTL